MTSLFVLVCTAHVLYIAVGKGSDYNQLTNSLAPLCRYGNKWRHSSHTSFMELLGSISGTGSFCVLVHFR